MISLQDTNTAIKKRGIIYNITSILPKTFSIKQDSLSSSSNLLTLEKKSRFCLLISRILLRVIRNKYLKNQKEVARFNKMENHSPLRSMPLRYILKNNYYINVIRYKYVLKEKSRNYSG